MLTLYSNLQQSATIFIIVICKISHTLFVQFAHLTWHKSFDTIKYKE